MWHFDKLPTGGTIVSYCQAGVRNSVSRQRPASGRARRQRSRRQLQPLERVEEQRPRHINLKTARAGPLPPGLPARVRFPNAPGSPLCAHKQRSAPECPENLGKLMLLAPRSVEPSASNGPPDPPCKPKPSTSSCAVPRRPDLHPRLWHPKAATSYFTGTLSDRYVRKPVLVACGLPVISVQLVPAGAISWLRAQLVQRNPDRVCTSSSPVRT